MSDSLVFGYAVVLIDVALWRFKVPKQDVSRLLLRLAIFAVFTASIFTAGLSPFRQGAHWPSSQAHSRCIAAIAIAGISCCRKHKKRRGSMQWSCTVC